MYKVLFAINSEKVEQEIIKNMDGIAISAGIVQYQEAIIPALSCNGADVLLIREELPGTMDFLELIKSIRIRATTVRIICLLSERERTDPMLSGLVSLGIYDIINQNQVSISDFVSHIAEPRTFRDVAQYFEPSVPEPAAQPEEKKSTGKKLFEGLFRKPSKKSDNSLRVEDISGNSDTGIDIETMRNAIQEEANRKVRAEVDQIASEMAKQQTKELSDEIAQLKSKLTEMTHQKKNAEEQSYHALSERDASRKELFAVNQELEDLRRRSSETISTYKEQLSSLSSNGDNSELAAQKAEEWMKKEQSYQEQVRSLTEQLETAKTGLQQAQANSQVRCIGEVDVTGGAQDCIIMPEDPADFASIKNAQAHTYLFVGSKHGVGNTTAALNFAAALASNGFKTLFMEFNERYPLTNEYFEFTSVPRGIDTALDGLKMNNKLAIDAAIIKPHGIATKERPLKRAYDKLPAALHFMVFSNNRLAGEKESRNTPLDGKDLLNLIAYLKDTLDYLYIVMDIQPDDKTGRMIWRTCANSVDQIVITCDQYLHSIATAGMILTDLSQNSKIPDSLHILVNRFDERLDMSAEKISKWLRLSPERLLTLSDDREGYYKAIRSIKPYALLDAPFAKEYFNLTAKI